MAADSCNNTKFGNGTSWIRGSIIGKGNYGSVYLATPKNSKSSYYPSLMAVKSAEVSNSSSIQKEREILSNIKGSPNIVHCFGEETTISSSGSLVYNLLLEYASGGTLASQITSSPLPESQVRFFTRSILRGLHHIHSIGYVHCDLKPDNILLMTSSSSNFQFRVKIGDFGLAKRVVMKQGKKRRKLEEANWRGTPMYLSPEAVIESIQEAPSDIWALGCIVLEMLTGKAPWEEGKEILARIGEGVMPKVPEGLSLLAKDFLKGCFVRNPRFRLTAEMLLSKGFVEGLEGEMEDGVVVEDLDEEESILIVSDEDEDSSDWSCYDLGEEGGWSSEEGGNVSSISEERELMMREGDDDDKVVSRDRCEDGFSIGVGAGV